jgi:hypothetical protein
VRAGIGDLLGDRNMEVVHAVLGLALDTDDAIQSCGIKRNGSLSFGRCAQRHAGQGKGSM